MRGGPGALPSDPALSDRSLLGPARLRERLDALDRLEHALIHASGEQRVRIERLCAELEAENARLYREIREGIIRGGNRRRAGAETLLGWARDGGTPGHADDHRYDHLDALVGGVLQIDEPAQAAALSDDMVSYQPTPARHAFAVIERTGLTKQDVLVDIGSGLGHVSLLAAICTPARCIGIERDAAYVDCARRCAEALGLRTASFQAQDAREADLSGATVFYLYTPFRGAMLDGMLARFEREASRRAIRICTLGPCTDTFARAPWLATDDPLRNDVPVLFRSR